MPPEVVNIILSYIDIHCHSCFNSLNNVNCFKNCKKMDRNYFCDQTCFEFV